MQTGFGKKRSLFISEPVWIVLINILSNSHSEILYVFFKTNENIMAFANSI